MDILLWIVVIIGGGTGLLSCLYIIFSLFGMIGYKIYRKIRYHASLYDQEESNMDIIVIIMGVIAAVAGVAGFIMEHRGSRDDDSSGKTEQ